MKIKPRTNSPSQTHSEKFGLLAWLEETRVQLPLKGVECRFDVSGDLASVEIDQIFHQNNPRPLDCLYTFPLPAGAAVFRCELHVNGRIISARVEEAECAQQMAEAKKAAGYRTALVRMERDNLFTLELGNVGPGDLVVIRFAYFQTVTRWGDEVSLNIPFCPGVRYIPGQPLLRSNLGRGTSDDTDQVPDASRISPPRLDALHPDAAYLTVEGRLEQGSGEMNGVRSPSHPLIVKDREGHVLVTIADRGAIPDCDLALRWTEPAAVELRSVAWLHAGKAGSYALLRLRAPELAASPAEHAQDVYFLVDRSGSMAGLKWSQACEALRAFLRTLAPQDRVWTTFFEDRFQDVAEKPLPPAALLGDPSVQNIESIGTGGGTQLLPALQHVLAAAARHSKGRNIALVLITDGQVGNEAEILEMLRPCADIRIHTFGIDTAVNDGFLKKLANSHRGTCFLASPEDDIVGTVARLGDRLRRPILVDLKVRAPWQPPEKTIPDLHAGEIINLSLRGPEGESPVEWEATGADGSIQRFQCLPIHAAKPALTLLWARARIDALLADGQTAEARALAREHNLLCDGMAFIAWDETEQVMVGQPRLELYQPSMQVRSAVATQCLSALPPAPVCGAAIAPGSHSASPAKILPAARAALSQAVRGWGFGGRRVKAVDSQPLMRTTAGSWRAVLERDEWLGRTELSGQLLDWLEQWCLADPKERAARERELGRIVEALGDTRKKFPSQAAWLQKMQETLERLLQSSPAFAGPVRNVLAQMSLASMA